MRQISSKLAVGLAAFFLLFAPAGAGDSYFAEHSLFKGLVGKWEASGELTAEDGSKLTLSETWTGAIEENGNLLIKGSRQFNEESHDFEWEYLYNPSTELIEGVMRISTSEDEHRLEVNVSEQDKTITLTSPLGGDGSSLRIVNKIEDGKITGAVKLTNPDGVESLSGEVVHEKKKDRE